MADLSADRYIEAPALGLELYRDIAKLPIVSPHGHIDVRLFADSAARLDPPGHPARHVPTASAVLTS